MGDLDADGDDDLAVSAIFNDDGRGEVYVVRSDGSALAATGSIRHVAAVPQHVTTCSDSWGRVTCSSKHATAVAGLCHRVAVRILPYQRLTIETPLSPEEVVNRLVAEVNPPPSEFATRRSLHGWIIEDTLEVHRPETFWNYNSFRAVAKGRIVPGRTGTSIELTLTITTFARVFLSVWLWITGAFFVGFAIAYLRDTRFGREAWPVGLALLPGGYLIGLMYFRAEAGKVIYHLRRLLGTPGR